MKSQVLHPTTLVDWDVAARPLAGQVVSGDLHLVKPFEQGVLIAVLDGVGHGDEATAAARTAATLLESHAHESIIALVKRCHKALTRTRGVVLTLASIRSTDNTLTWLGVGNVEGRLLRAGWNSYQPAECVLLRGGLVGYQLPALQASVVPIAPGDLLVLVTDGIDGRFEETVRPGETPGQTARRILARHFKGTDDALVFVARYRGSPHE